jgi:hypothetical protein
MIRTWSLHFIVDSLVLAYSSAGNEFLRFASSVGADDTGHVRSSNDRNGKKLSLPLPQYCSHFRKMISRNPSMAPMANQIRQAMSNPQFRAMLRVIHFEMFHSH